jgi:hypothetical protein
MAVAAAALKWNLIELHKIKIFTYFLQVTSLFPKNKNILI